MWAIFPRKWPAASKLLQTGVCNRLQVKNRCRHVFSVTSLLFAGLFIIYLVLFYLKHLFHPFGSFLSCDYQNKAKLWAILNALLPSCLGAHCTPMPHVAILLTLDSANFFSICILRVVSHYSCLFLATWIDMNQSFMSSRIFSLQLSLMANTVVTITEYNFEKCSVKYSVLTTA